MTERQLAGQQRRTLRAIRRRLLRMAEAWTDLDQFNFSQLMDLADKAEQVAVGMTVDEE